MVYLNLKEIVDPGRTALLVWDVQNLLVSRIFNKEEFLKNLKSFITAVRTNNISIIYTKHSPLPRKYESSFRILMFMKRFGFKDPEKVPQPPRPGSQAAEIYNDASPLDGDVVLNKNTSSVFIGTNFENMIRNRGIETILFTGISTDAGISSSARDSSNRGFYTIVVQDCASSFNQEMHEAALKALQSVCLVESSENLIKEWKKNVKIIA